MLDLRDAEVLHERSSAARRSTSFKPIAAANPGVTFINVEPYQLKLVDGQLQPVLDARSTSSRRPTSRTSGACSSEPWIFAVDRNGVVQGSYEVTITPAELDARSCRSSPPAEADRPASTPAPGRVLEPDRRPASPSSVAVPDADRLRGRLVLDEVAGRELGRRSRGRPGRTRASAVVGRRSVKPRTLVEPGRVDPTMTPTAGLVVARWPGSRCVPPSSNAAPPVRPRSTRDGRARRGSGSAGPPVRVSAAAPAPIVPVPVLPGA